MRKAIPALILLLALLLSACAAQTGESYSLTLWYVEGEPLAPALIRLAEDYNRSRGRDSLAVTTRAWTDEEQLLNALQTGARPALILCSHALAFSLYDRELLVDPALAFPAYPAWLRERSDCVGRGFYPIGFELPLLCVQDGFPARIDALLERAAAYGRETGEPCLAADRFAPLFYQVLLDAGTEFGAYAPRDAFSPDYVNFYNALTGAVFDRGLSADTAAETPCRIESSTALRARDLSGCSVFPLSDGPLLAEGCGLAVTVRDSRMQRELPDFLRWLMKSGRPGRAALEAGLIPAAEEALSPKDALEEALVSLMGRSLHLPDAESCYYVNRSVFEEDFRAALELLH